MATLQLAALALAISAPGETVLLDFYSDHCPPCRMVAPTVKRLVSKGYPVRKVNIDRDPGLKAQYGVTAIPCFVLLVDGREVERFTGPADITRFERMFQRAGIFPSGPNRNHVRLQSPDSRKRLNPFPLVPNRAPQTLAGNSPRSGNRPARWQSDGLRSRSKPLRSKPLRRPAPSELEARLLQASVRLEIQGPTGSSFGSGTIIDVEGDEALVLTCGHIFQASQGRAPIRVTLFDSGSAESISGRLLGFDPKHDIGLVSIRTSAAVVPVLVAPSDFTLSSGDRVISVGCNNGGQPIAHESRVTALDKYVGPANVEVAGQPVKGSSGGGLFSPDGFLVGVCNAEVPDQKGLFAAVSLIHTELDRAKLAHVYRNNPGGTLPKGGLVAAEPPPPLPKRTASDPMRLRQTRPSTSDSIGQLNRSEYAALEEIRKKLGDPEVICIVRSQGNQPSDSQIIVLDKATPDFRKHLEELAWGRKPRQSVSLTSLTAPPRPPKAVPFPVTSNEPNNNWRASGQ